MKSFTMMFLQNWNITERGQESYERYLEHFEDGCPAAAPRAGYVMPYGDSPLDNENVGKQVYMDILYQAKRYVHMMTPYLILDQDMIFRPDLRGQERGGDRHHHAPYSGQDLRLSPGQILL